jgi:hypothetical protein
MDMNDCPYKNDIERLKESANRQDEKNIYEKEEFKQIHQEIKEIKSMLMNGYLEKKIKNSIERYIYNLLLKFILAGGGAGALVSYIINLFGS